jgi:arylsulfatase A-like enzyme
MACSNWTLASTFCTMLGRYPIDVGAAPEVFEEQVSAPMPDVPMLPLWLGEAGFYSVLSTANLMFSDAHNNAQGFDQIAQFAVSTDAVRVAAQGALLLDEGTADRWYLHLHLMEPHRPYTAPEAFLEELDGLGVIPYDLSNAGAYAAIDAAWATLSQADQDLIGQHLQVRYGGTGRWLDTQLADIWAELEAQGLLDDTLVVVWTDHGEAFFERDRQAHGWMLLSEENDGIALFWHPGITPLAWGQPTTSIDIAPTVLSLLGLAQPDDVDGLVVGEAAADRARFASTAAKMGVVQSVRQGDHRLQFVWETGLVQVFDVVSDPDETVDLFDANDPVTLALWAALLPRIALHEAAMPHRSVIWPEGLAQSDEQAVPD